MDEQPLGSIKATGNSLASHLQAIDLLTARVKCLPSRTKWPARIPLNGKASVKGQVVHTNEFKVDIGAGYFIEMTAKEAEEYCQRRKTALLLQHAGLRENAGPTDGPVLCSDINVSASVSFSPLFAMPPAAGPSHRRVPPVFSAPEALSQDQEADVKGKGRAVDPVADFPAISGTPGVTLHSQGPQEDEAQSLMDVVEKFLEVQQGLSNMPNEERQDLSGDRSNDALVTEEGLPIHEIREDFNGRLIGAAPQPTTNGDPRPEVSEDVDYWSEEAKAKREALRRKIFNEDDSDGDLSENEPEQPVSNNVTAPLLAVVEKDELEPSSPPARRPSSFTAPPTRSILKAPPRKKSVSFDDSVPVPPDSPPAKMVKMGFPLPVSEVSMPEMEFQPRPVPLIATPKPAVKANVGETFGGFKRGFLTGPSVVTKPAEDPPSLPPKAETQAGNSKPSSKFAKEMAAKKQAQSTSTKIGRPSVVASKEEATERLLSIAASPSLPVSPNATASAVKDVVAERTLPMNGLPRFSETRPMGSMKNRVVEREPAPSAINTIVNNEEYEVDNYYDEDHPYDDDEDDEDEDEDDQYDLDEALLAREVALDYHRRQGYISKYTREVDSDGEEQEPGEYQVNSDGEVVGSGGVLMGLPQISSEGQIINPTPDDLRKYVRVGRLQNGNLVLAPGEDGWSSDEDAEKKAKREAVRRRLAGIEEPSQSGRASQATSAEPIAPPSNFADSLPPVVSTTREVPEREVKQAVKAVGEVKERDDSASIAPAEPTPKKVSRFKAARMGMEMD